MTSWTDDAAHRSPSLIVFVFFINVFHACILEVGPNDIHIAHADFGCCSTSHSITLS
jgi:hypothetical protein